MNFDSSLVKYRRQVIDDTISDYAKDMFIRLGENYNISLVEWNHDIDHVHICSKHIRMPSIYITLIIS
jgi:putative transposase